ncbi:MAG: flagellar assembly peptidoglycan hydrolase FlgJ [Gammaproteobacteria bacterium]|nr:flagellar assembly peptidoglycan hydrolase FlgJ [Gammaproteobacteria bacterium]
MTLNTHIAHTAIDFQGLAELRRSATKDSKDQETLRQVAGQFEALFVNMMLKSMRQAKLADGIFDSSQSDMYRDMADQQLAMDMSARGGLGLQDVIMRQLGGPQLDHTFRGQSEKSYSIDSINVRPALKPVIQAAADVQKVIAAAPEKANISQQEIKFNSPESFVQQLWPMAKQAADKIGVKPEVIIAQAALETGWGKHIINHRDGQSSHNLFNIKADKRWDGESAVIGTVEYRGGVAVKEQAQFRSYETYQQSFDDYVNFLQTQPRYRQALEHTQNPERFVEELHKAGYATDPAYAEKVKRIMNGSTLAQISQQLKYS